MGQSLQPEEEPTVTVPAAQVRVTPQELASALARLESRREAGRHHEAGTIALGEAVQELALPVTPEELWREVQTGRVQAAPQKTIFSLRQRLGLFLAAGALLWGATGWWSATNSAVPSTALVPPPVVAAPAMPQPAPITVPSGLLVRDAANRMVLLSEVAEDRPVLCNLTATDQAAAFAPFAPDSLHWTLIKHSGGVYLRGWIADMSPAALRSSPVEVHPVRDYVATGLHPVPVTLPVDGFASTPGLTNDDMISATGVKPDGHFREKW